jgi:hypothetical protein
MYRTVSRPAPCLGRLAVVWALYGCAVAMLWQMTANRVLPGGLVWTGAALAGIALALREF